MPRARRVYGFPLSDSDSNKLTGLTDSELDEMGDEMAGDKIEECEEALLNKCKEVESFGLLPLFEIGYLYLCILGVAQRTNFPCLPARQESWRDWNLPLRQLEGCMVTQPMPYGSSWKGQGHYPFSSSGHSARMVSTLRNLILKHWTSHLCQLVRNLIYLCDYL